MTKRLFVSGTDTDAGKTFVSSLVLQGFSQLGLTAIGAKPIAAGAEPDQHGQLQNSDALLLRQYSGIALPYQQHNPICLAKPAAPHLAAAELNLTLDEAVLTANLQQLTQSGAELVLVEGAGGWLLPLSSARYLADWVAAEQLPVLLVVGIKLGCLNHAMLTVREIERSGCRLAGWVANIMQPEMLFLEENIADLKVRIAAPLIATVPYQPDAALQQALAKQLASALLSELTDVE